MIMHDKAYVDLDALTDLKAELVTISNEMFEGKYYNSVLQVNEFYDSVIKTSNQYGIPKLLGYCGDSFYMGNYDYLCNDVKNLIGAIDETIRLTEQGTTDATKLFDLFNKNYTFAFNSFGSGFNFQRVISATDIIYTSKKALYFQKLANIDFSKIDTANIEDDDYKAQGIFVKDDKLFISAQLKGEKSRVYVYDLNTTKCIGYIILNTTAHVGGVIYDYNNDLMIVSNGSKANCYNMTNLEKMISYDSTRKGQDFVLGDLNKEEYAAAILDNDMNVSKVDRDCKNSTMFYDDGKVYVATFNTKDGAELVQYDVTNYIQNEQADHGSINFGNPRVYKGIKEYTQGIASYNYNDEQYIISCNSMAIGGTTLNAYKINDYNLELVGSKKIDYDGGESLFINSSDNIVVANERGKPLYEVSAQEVITSHDSSDSPPSREMAGWVYENFMS